METKVSALGDCCAAVSSAMSDHFTFSFQVDGHPPAQEKQDAPALEEQPVELRPAEEVFQQHDVPAAELEMVEVAPGLTFLKVVGAHPAALVPHSLGSLAANWPARTRPTGPDHRSTGCRDHAGTAGALQRPRP